MLFKNMINLEIKKEQARKCDVGNWKIFVSM